MALSINLSVDWDYFMLNVPDHSEEYPPYTNALWWAENNPSGLRSFARFWQRFNIHPSTTVLVAESHVQAYAFFQKDHTPIVSFDSHADLGYPDEQPQIVTCGDWLKALLLEGLRPSWVIYPTEKRLKLDARKEWQHLKVKRSTSWDHRRCSVNRVFICKSPGWSHPKYDPEFLQFVESCPGQIYWQDSCNVLRLKPERVTECLVKDIRKLSESKIVPFICRRKTMARNTGAPAAKGKKRKPGKKATTKKAAAKSKAKGRVAAKKKKKKR